MSQKLVRQALEVALNTWALAQVPAVSIAWQNKTFTPVANTKYAKAFLLPAETQNPSLGDAHRRLIGIFQVSLYMPIGVGSSAGEVLAESLSDYFARGESFTAAGLTTRILNSPSTGPQLADEGYYVIPISIPYTTDDY